MNFRITLTMLVVVATKPKPSNTPKIIICCVVESKRWYDGHSVIKRADITPIPPPKPHSSPINVINRRSTANHTPPNQILGAGGASPSAVPLQTGFGNFGTRHPRKEVIRCSAATPSAETDRTPVSDILATRALFMIAMPCSSTSFHAQPRVLVMYLVQPSYKGSLW